MVLSKKKDEQKVEKGDELTLEATFKFDDKVVQEEKEYSYTWEQKQVYGVTVDGFEDQVLGMAPGDEKTFQVELPEYMLTGKERIQRKTSRASS